MPQQVANGSAESTLRRYLRREESRFRKELADLLGDPPNASNVPLSFWSDLKTEQKDALMAGMLGAAMEDARDLLDLYGADDIALDSLFGRIRSRIRDRVDAMAHRMSLSSRRMVRRLSDNAEHNARQIATQVFGFDRSTDIAATEGKYARSTGIAVAMDMLREQGLETLGVWRLGAADHCPVCRALEGSHDAVWRLVGAPPIHPRCQCYIENYGGSLERAKELGIVESVSVSDIRRLMNEQGLRARRLKSVGMLWTPGEERADGCGIGSPEDSEKSCDSSAM